MLKEHVELILNTFGLEEDNKYNQVNSGRGGERVPRGGDLFQLTLETSNISNQTMSES